MGALFGHTGPPDERLHARMSASLAHRGAVGEARATHGGATLGYRAQHDGATRERLGGGLHEDGAGRAAALVGYLTAPATRPALPALLDAWREHGPDVVQDVRGAFVLALWDGSALHLVRDGVGARTVYWGVHEGRLLFAVEPKGVLAAPGFPRRMRPGAVAQYLTFSFVPGGDTMIAGLHELPAGHRLVWDGGGPRLVRWFRFEDEEKEAGDEATWAARFRETHAQAVAERLALVQRPGDDGANTVFLSGGLDSSAVTVEVARQRARRALDPANVHAYSIHFGAELPNELSFARAVVARVGTRHEEVQVRPKGFLPGLRRMVWHLDEPVGDPVTMPNFELAAHVRARLGGGTPFVWNGEGGDPLFGGPKNLTMMLHHWYGGAARPDGFRERAYLASYRRCYEDLERLLTPEFRAQYDEEEALVGVLRPYFEADRPRLLLDKLMAINIRLKGAHLILPKVERMLAAHGLVPLSPLFDERLVRLSFRMPATCKLKGGVEKLVMKRAYEAELPAEVVWRPKSGMRVPVHSWFRGELRRFARRVLSRRALVREGIFEPARVKQLLDYETVEGPGRYGLRLWMLVTFELWRRIVLEGEAP